MDWICCFSRRRENTQVDAQISASAASATTTVDEQQSDTEPIEAEPLPRLSQTLPDLTRQQTESDLAKTVRRLRRVLPAQDPRQCPPHEPPVLDYEKYEFYDSVQKHFKATAKSSADLAWKTGYLDLMTEHQLLDDYRTSMKAERDALTHIREASARDGSDGEAMKEAFYRELVEDINLEAKEVRGDTVGHLERYGKNGEDEIAILMVILDAARYKKILEEPEEADDIETDRKRMRSRLFAHYWRTRIRRDDPESVW